MTKAKSGQPKSRVGQGMKPRGNAEGIKVESVTEEKPVSTDQVQTEGTEQPSHVAPDGEQTPPSQEPKTDIFDPMQSFDAVVGSSSLAELLRQSAAGTENHVKVKPADDPAQVLAAIDKDAQERHAMAMEPHPSQAPIRPPEPKDEVVTNGVVMSNGDCMVVVTIPEEYVTGVRDFAAADGQKTMEQWCTEFFVMNLEAYCTPMKGR